MAKVAVVTFELASPGGKMGGVGAFTLHWAQLLQRAGEEVTVFLAHVAKPMAPAPAVMEQLAALRLPVVELHDGGPSEQRSPHLPALALSERLAELLRAFDVAYFPDYPGFAAVPARRRRLPGEKMPVCVTVMHGPGQWVRVGNQRYDVSAIHPEVDYQERYSAEQADWIASPSRYLVEWVRGRGWQLRPGRTRLLGLPFLPSSAAVPAARSVEPIDHLIYFGRLETRKGYALFAEALELLRRRHPEAASRLRKVTLLGAAHHTVPDAAPLLAKLRRLGWAAEHRADLDSAGAAAFLAAQAARGMAVMPSLPDGDNFPYTVIESTMVGGLRLIASAIGGIPEMLPEGDCLFEPHAAALAGKLAQCLLRPADAGRARPYDWQGANRRWLDFHAEVVAESVPAAAGLRYGRSPALDVCIPYYNKPETFPQTLDSLARQSSRDFTVIAVDDGSPDAAAREVFDRMAAQYAPRGWTFFRTENGFASAARNRAAARGTSEYLLFLDADDALPSHALDRLLECIRATGDDLLVPGMCGFEGQGSPLNAEGQLGVPVRRWMLPLGPALVSALQVPAVLGGPTWIVRRQAFEAVGGYVELRSVHEDWDLLVRLSLRGFRIDVLPEYLHLYRMGDPGSLSQTSNLDAAQARLIEAYETHLRAQGLPGMAELMWALQREYPVPAAWVDEAVRHAGELNTPRILRPLQAIYRNAVPPEWRLRLHQSLMLPLARLFGRRRA